MRCVLRDCKSAETAEILDNVHKMSKAKRYLIGISILLVVIAVVVAFIFLLKLAAAWY